MKLVVAVSIAFVMLFGVTGCGSDEITQLEARVDALEEQAGSRVKNAAPEASGASDALSKTDCDRLDRRDLSDLDDLLDLLDRLDRLDLSDLRDLLDLSDRLDRLDLDLDLRDQCDAASDGGADSVTTTTEPPTPATEPEGDDVDES